MIEECPGCDRPLADHRATAVRGPGAPVHLRPCGTTVAPELLAEERTAPAGIAVKDHTMLTAEGHGEWLYGATTEVQP